MESRRKVPMSGPPIRGKGILVVEDQPEVASILVDLLLLDDYRVDTVANGALALERLRERAYDVILSDIRMPELDGPGLYREAVRRHPELRQRFVFISGSALDPQTRKFLQETRAPSLGKPFEVAEVRQVVQRILAAPA